MVNKQKDNNPLVSVVIRTRNEMPKVKNLFKFIREEQSYKNVEIVVIDNLSKDGTYEFCCENAGKVVTIENFTHAKSTNLGTQSASGEFVYFTNGHTLPIHKNMFSDSIQRFHQSPKLAGIYGLEQPNKNEGNLLENLYGYINREIAGKRGFTTYKKFRYPMLHTISSIIRRSLLLKHPYSEKLKNGGEDCLLARQLIADGFEIAYSPYLDVYHSHGGTIWDGIRRYGNYNKLMIQVELHFWKSKLLGTEL